MPTRPIPQVLQEPVPGSTQDRLLHQFANGIAETVHFGTHILHWSTLSSTGQAWETPLLLLFRHSLETLDAIGVLLRAGAVEPCKMLLRGLFESLLSSEYILQTDSQRRALCFLVGYLNWEVGMSERLNSASSQGRRFRRKLNKDRILNGLRLPELAGESPRVLELERLLAQPLFEEVNREFADLKRRTNRTPIWYSMFDGPRNLESLAAHVELPGLYEYLYRRWSGAVHGLEVFDGKLKGRDGIPYITQLRAIDNAQHVTLHTLWLQLQHFQSFVGTLLPERLPELDLWFLKELQPLYHLLSGELMYSIDEVYHTH
ncbi:MAG: hypothetical protein H6678_03345 [Candidatus Delongbacteria bacterium]|nr:hypothetical protein [Candidatus Cloacimonadota bacterium]MCB9472828.1 hypothetical protein [Candidatus Delongbacteria bacterium]